MDKIRTRVNHGVNTGHFLFRFLHESKDKSAGAQQDFVDRTTVAATGLDKILRRHNLIQSAETDPKYWSNNRGTIAAFIDGGMAKIDVPYAPPVGIRVGSYTVETGRSDEGREQFKQELILVEDLFGEHMYESEYDDTSRLVDAARILCEASVAMRMAEENDTLNFVLLHGPLLNPASPYGMEDFPALSPDLCADLLRRDASLFPEKDDRSFVAVYLEIQKRIFDAAPVVAGVVERTRIQSANVILSALRKHLPKPSFLQAKELIEKDLKLSDQQICSLVLNPGEYLDPVLDNRQGKESHWPQKWKSRIRKYPEALITYLKPSETSEPFRVEINGKQNFASALDLIFQTSKLLPTYGFPVGLDIVDKYAKVPNWMTRAVRGQHAVALLKAAIRDGNPHSIKFAKNVLLSKGRDWLYRPKA